MKVPQVVTYCFDAVWEAELAIVIKNQINGWCIVFRHIFVGSAVFIVS